MPRRESAVLGGLPFTSADYCDFRIHGPHMRNDDLSAPSGRFVARVSAFVTTVDRCPGRGRTLPAADNDSLRSSPYPPRSTRVPQKPLLLRRPSPSRLLQRSPTQGIDTVETTGPTASAPASPGSPMPPTVKPSWDRISTRTRRCTATTASAAPPAVDYGFGLGGAPRLFARRARTPRRVRRPRPGPPIVAAPAPAAFSVLTVSTPSDCDRADPVGIPLLRLTPPLGDTPPAPAKLDPLATLLYCSSLIPSRVFPMSNGSDNSWLSRRATPQGVTSQSVGRRPCQPTFCRATLRTTNRHHRRMRIGPAQR